MRNERQAQRFSTRQLIAAGLITLAAACAVAMLGFTAALAAPEEAGAGLLLALDGQGRLLPLEVEAGPFDATLSFGDAEARPVKQNWQYNIYAQFYFPGEDPQIDYTFLGNRRYPRLLLKLDRRAALIWVSSASTRAEALEYCQALRRQGLEGAFVARARGEYGYAHTEAEQRALDELAAQLDPVQCKGADPREWIEQRDIARHYAMGARLIYIDGISGVNDALSLRDAVKAEVGECGMLNRPGGGYRLFCGAYNDLAATRDASVRIQAATGYKPTVICLNADGLETRWMEEDLGD